MRLDGKRVLITGTAGGQGEAAQAMFAREGPPGGTCATGNCSIINTASMSGLRGIAPLGQAAHSAAKGGVIALTRTLAAEGAPDGIRASTPSRRDS